LAPRRPERVTAPPPHEPNHRLAGFEHPDRGGTTMLLKHQHTPGEFDPGHCRDCARESDLLDHYHRVQREEQAVKEAQRWARQAHRYAVRALWSSGIGILLAAIALLTG
jgi:hypothetical protein